MRVPGAVAGPPGSQPTYVAVSGRWLWVGRRGATHRYRLEDVVMASIVDVPDGALRVDFLAGDPLVVLVLDGGLLHARLVSEIRAIDRRLHLDAFRALGLPDLSPWRGAGESGVHRAPDPRETAEGVDVLREAQLIVQRELRVALSSPAG